MKMAKIVYNARYGGFRLSGAALARGREISGDLMWGRPLSGDALSRHDPVLVQVVEELGTAANTDVSYLKIEEIPSGTRYHINDYCDGMESVETPETYEWIIAP